MSKTSAQDYYNQQAGDPDDGYITPDDAKASVGVIYDDMAAADNLAAKAANVGNLLTANQASVETDTTGLGAFNDCTIARSTAQARVGSASLALTATGVTVCAGATYTAVTPGETYTAAMSIRSASASRTGCVAIGWYTSDTTLISQVLDGPSATVGSGAWSDLAVTAVAPATAAYAQVYSYILGCTAGEVFYIDALGIWRGAGGQWALPGLPITGTGYQVRAGGLVDVWDGTQWLNIGTGTPVVHAQQLPAPEILPGG
jgi:hypothetical protein